MKNLKIYNIKENKEIKKIKDNNINDLINNILYNYENEIFLIKENYIKIYYDHKNLKNFILIKNLKENEIKLIKECFFNFINIEIKKDQIIIKNYYFNNIFHDLNFLLDNFNFKQIINKEKNNLKNLNIYFRLL